MKRIWRSLSSEELKDYENIKQDKFGTFKPTIFQSFLIFVAQRSFFKRGQLRRLIAFLTYTIRKKPLDIYFRNCALIFKISKSANPPIISCKATIKIKPRPM